MTVTNNTNTKLIEKYRLHPKDKGSTEVQVAVISNRISSLTEHLKVNQKDQSCIHGLQKLVGKRKRLLRFLKSKSNEKYLDLIKNLGLRK